MKKSSRDHLLIQSENCVKPSPGSIGSSLYDKASTRFWFNILHWNISGNIVQNFFSKTRRP